MTLPVHTEPLPLESFASWFDRLAAAHGVGVGDLLDHAGIDRTSSGGVRLWGVWMSDDDLHNVSWLSGVPQGWIWSGLLADYSHGALCCDLDLAHVTSPTAASRVAARAWASFRGTRACPACVAQHGAWDRSWKLSTSAVCTVHKVLLSDACPACLTPWRQGPPSRSAPAYPSLVPQPAACDNPHPGTESGRARRCGHPLSEVRPSHLARDRFDEGGTRTLDLAGRRLVAAQDVHDEAAVRARMLVVDGRPATTHEWFLALRDLFALSSCLLGPDDLGPLPQLAVEAMTAYAEGRDRLRARGDAAPGYRQPPKTAAHAAALLPSAVEALEADDLADALAPLVDAAARSERPQWRTLHEQMCESDHVRSAWDRAVAGHWRFSELSGRSEQRPEGGYGIEPRHLPQLVPARVYGGRFAALLPGTATHTGRLFAGLAVARVVTGGSWPLAAVALEVDDRKARNCFDVVSRRVEDGPAFWDAVHRHARDVDRMPRVDYAARRWALRDVIEAPKDDWVAMCREEGVHPGRTEARRRNRCGPISRAATGAGRPPSPWPRATERARTASATTTVASSGG